MFNSNDDLYVITYVVSFMAATPSTSGTLVVFFVFVVLLSSNACFGLFVSLFVLDVHLEMPEKKTGLLPNKNLLLYLTIIYRKLRQCQTSPAIFIGNYHLYICYDLPV